MWIFFFIVCSLWFRMFGGLFWVGDFVVLMSFLYLFFFLLELFCIVDFIEMFGLCCLVGKLFVVVDDDCVLRFVVVIIVVDVVVGIVL